MTTATTKTSLPAGKLNKKYSPTRDKVIHVSNSVHKKLKIFCATLELDLGITAEKAITDYITKNS